MHAAKHSGGSSIAAIVSAIALVFSGYSLWETSLKQADLSVYVTGVVSYVRDASGGGYLSPPNGFEVFAVPVTIANSGARDGPVLSMQLDVKNRETGLTARFEATYTADAAYFGTIDNLQTGSYRPKAPFSAVVIAGRSAWTGTILFYPVSYSNEKVLTPMLEVRKKAEELRTKYGDNVELSNLPEFKVYHERLLTQKGKVDVTLKIVRPAPSGWLDRVLGAPVPPVTLTLEMPDIPTRVVEYNYFFRLRTVAAGS
jgi:hypothetical protein